MKIRLTITVFFLLCFSVFTFCSPTSSDIINAAKKNDIKAVTFFLQNGGDPNCIDKDGFTPIMFAAVNNYVELTKFLISRPNINLNAKNSFGYSALTLAVVFGNTEIADILKKAGAKE